MNFLTKLVASGLGTGFSPVAPGTAGSALAAAAAWLLRDLWSVPLALGLSAIAAAAGVAACNRAERFWGHDSGRMVIDEIAGQWLTLCLVPLNVTTISIGFLIFRTLDIIKPPPARHAESLPGGWGVMADDLVAGALGAVILWGVVRWM
ncbi:MAG: phosphatidylglycerophosphatase A [Candidatus Glassbacteria bacterium]|nr:phosphatidylglycerophosphatase A [Candidatus Glassbacteria bacterium]